MKETTEMSDKKRKPKKFLTLAEKKQVIEEAEKGYSGRKIALKFEVDRTVVAKILREKERILIEYGQNTNPNRKRNFLSTKHNELNEKVYELFKTCMERNIPVTGPLLQKKALLIAANLNIQGFVASNGWLDKFRTRHNIHFKALSGLTPDPLLIDDGYLGGTIEQITDSVLNNFIEVDVKVAGKQEPIFEEEEEEPAFEEDHPIISYTEALNCIDKLEKYVAEKDPDSLILTQTLKSNIVKQKEMKKQTSLLNYFSVYSKFVNK